MSLRTLALTTAALAGFALSGAAPAGAAVRDLDYWQYQSTHPTQAQCDAAAQPWLWPANPGGADGYSCEPKNGAWDLYLIFAT